MGRRDPWVRVRNCGKPLMHHGEPRRKRTTPMPIVDHASHAFDVQYLRCCGMYQPLTCEDLVVVVSRLASSVVRYGGWCQKAWCATVKAGGPGNRGGYANDSGYLVKVRRPSCHGCEMGGDAANLIFIIISNFDSVDWEPATSCLVNFKHLKVWSRWSRGGWLKLAG